MRIYAYLTFNGNCREAMNFYKNCLGGDLTFQTIGEAPISGDLPGNIKDAILHATLRREDLMLMASDVVNGKKLSRGNHLSLMLNCNSEQEIRDCYTRLSAGGEQTHPVVKTYWGDLFGDLVDKFGNHWLLRFSRIC